TRQAILKASQTAEANQTTIADRTFGIAFLGTPHGGSEKTKWAEIGSKIAALVGESSDTLVKDLAHSSYRLVKIGQEFPQWLRKQSDRTGEKVSVICFFEALDTKLYARRVGKISNQIHGVLIMLQVVAKEEAQLPGGYETRPIEADHVGMCKCKDEHDPIYKIIVGVLQRWIKALEDDTKEELSLKGQYVSNSNWTGGTNNGQYIPQLVGAKGAPINFTNNAAPKGDNGR
ncbi:MAG: hypothetical protein Q9226_009187, partial [Calogaya cf. arnoldii]